MHAIEKYLPASLSFSAWVRRECHMVRMLSRWLARSLWVLTVLCVLLTIRLNQPLPSAFDALGLLAFATAGALIASRLPGNPIGWILSIGTVLWALGVVSLDYAAYGPAHQPQALPTDVGLAVFGAWARAVGWTLMVTFLLLLFPDGRLPSHRWRPVAWFTAALFPLWTVVAIMAPSSMDDRLSAVRSPLGARAASGLADLAISLSFLVMIACGVAIIGRFRRSRGEQRQQLKWLAYGILFPVGMVGLTLATGNGNLPWQQAIAVIPIAVGVAIFKYRLYDIDILINRTLVYGTLTASVVTLYVLVVGGLSTLLQDRGSLPATLLATGLVAVLFQPLRGRLQHGVNRMMYGERDDPYAVISQLGRRLEATLSPEAVLPAVVETVRQALKLPYAAIALERDGELMTVAASGAPVARPLTFPLVYQQEVIGRLMLTPRSKDEALTPADRRLLDDLSRQAGVAAHAVQLTAELQRARERLVTAREEERRRLRRDLHDGLGPQLGSQTLTLTAVRKLLRRDPDAAEALLDDAMMHAEEAIKDIRRLVYDLRPPALDDLGLVGSLREWAARYSQNGLQVTVEAPQPMPPLPAAVEVAIYRIAQEALTNVARHACTQTCTIRLEVDDLVRLEIADRGVGLPPDYRAGVGVLSMRERAAELGGCCTLEIRPGGGTIVRAHLPLWKDG